MSPKMVIAIDPGASGALASYTTTFEPPLMEGPRRAGEPSWNAVKLSQSPADRFEQLVGCHDTARSLEALPVAILEDIGGYAGIPHPGSAMFNFGRNYGQLEGFLIALRFQIIRVRPQKWQGELSLKTRKGESKPEHKRRMRERAMELFPLLKPTLVTCDALLILYWYIEKYHIEKYRLTKDS